VNDTWRKIAREIVDNHDKAMERRPDDPGCLDPDNRKLVARQADRGLVLAKTVLDHSIHKIQKIKAEVKPLRVGTPQIMVYEVELEDETGCWSETFGTRDLLNAFLKGVQAASSMSGTRVLDVAPKWLP